MIQTYKIILMDYDGEIQCEYNSYVVPAVNDTILIDDEISFLVANRHFSTNSLKVVLIGEKDKQIEIN